MKRMIFTLSGILFAVVYGYALTFNVTVPEGTMKCYIAGDFTS